MPPKHVNLAFAGRKLLGPPEGYDKKKELQVKRWLINNPPPQESDVAASIASVSEVRQALGVVCMVKANMRPGRKRILPYLRWKHFTSCMPCTIPVLAAVLMLQFANTVFSSLCTSSDISL